MHHPLVSTSNHPIIMYPDDLLPHENNNNSTTIYNNNNNNNIVKMKKRLNLQMTRRTALTRAHRTCVSWRRRRRWRRCPCRRWRWRWCPCRRWRWWSRQRGRGSFSKPRRRRYQKWKMTKMNFRNLAKSSEQKICDCDLSIRLMRPPPQVCFFQRLLPLWSWPLRRHQDHLSLRLPTPEMRT